MTRNKLRAYRMLLYDEPATCLAFRKKYVWGMRFRAQVAAIE
jgi:hypothetical protein